MKTNEQIIEFLKSLDRINLTDDTKRKYVIKSVASWLHLTESELLSMSSRNLAVFVFDTFLPVVVELDHKIKTRNKRRKDVYKSKYSFSSYEVGESRMMEFPPNDEDYYDGLRQLNNAIKQHNYRNKTSYFTHDVNTGIPFTTRITRVE